MTESLTSSCLCARHLRRWSGSDNTEQVGFRWVILKFAVICLVIMPTDLFVKPRGFCFYLAVSLQSAIASWILTHWLPAMFLLLCQPWRKSSGNFGSSCVACRNQYRTDRSRPKQGNKLRAQRLCLTWLVFSGIIAIQCTLAYMLACRL